MCNQPTALQTLSCDSPLSDSDWGESSLTLTLSHFAFVYDACPSLLSRSITVSSQEAVSTDLSSHSRPLEKMGHASPGCKVGHGSPGRKILKMAPHSS